MAIPAGVVRIVLSGTLYGGEIWSTGFWMTDTGVESNADAVSLADIITGTLTSSDASGAVRIQAGLTWSTQTTWTKTTVYSYNAGGNHAVYIGEYDLPAAVQGVQNSGVPNQVACVVSLRTGVAGRRNRGRMYMPLTGYGFSASGQLHDSDVAKIAAGWAAAFTDINASDTGKVVVVSAVGGTFQHVSQVIVDSKADTQRSRSRQETIDAIHADAVTP